MYQSQVHRAHRAHGIPLHCGSVAAHAVVFHFSDVAGAYLQVVDADGVVAGVAAVVVAQGYLPIGAVVARQAHCEVPEGAVGWVDGVHRHKGALVVGIAHHAHLEVGRVVVAVELGVEAHRQVAQRPVVVQVRQHRRAVLPSVGQRAVAVHVEHLINLD